MLEPYFGNMSMPILTNVFARHTGAVKAHCKCCFKVQSGYERLTAYAADGAKVESDVSLSPAILTPVTARY